MLNDDKDTIQEISVSGGTKRDLLKQRLHAEQQLDRVKQLPRSIPRRPEHSLIPLSFAQQRLWVIDQLHPDNIAYNVSITIRLHGRLDAPILEKALRGIIQRHEVLRTSFQNVHEQPTQKVQAEVQFTLPIVELLNLLPAEHTLAVERLAQKHAQASFNLAEGPLFRATLLRLAPDEHVLLITMHHIISDGWSLGIFNRDLAQLYSALVQHQPSPLPELPIQYGDFALWQRQWLEGNVQEQQLTYWKRQLTGAPFLLELPTDASRPAIQTFRGTTYSFPISQTMAEGLRKLGKQEGATLFMVLLAAFQVLLARYTGQDDLLIGSPIAGRTRAETEELIGFFVNTLVLRADLSGNPSFLDFLRKVRETCLEAYTHQELPFDRLVEELHPQRDLSRNPLVQVFFALQNTPLQVEEADGLSFNLSEYGNETAPVDIMLELIEISDGLQGRCLYNTDLFEAATIERMVGHYQTLLHGILVNPDAHISTLPLLTEAERQQILVEWNTTQTDFPRDRCIHELFESQVQEHPETLAVQFGDTSLTYRELDRRANQLAHYLQTVGVRPEVLVGLCVERSLEMIVGLLAILKAGGAYLPLEPSYPHERLTFMLEDAQISILLTQKHLRQYLPSHNVLVIVLDEVGIVSSEDTTKVPVTATTTSDNLAYVMYTSGSTGRPKGVSVSHRAIARLVKNTNYASFSANEVFLQFAPIAFDASTFEIWGPLLNGARLVVFPESQARLDELGDFMQKHGVTTVWLTAGLFHHMVEQHISAFRSVRQLLAGGDVLSVSHVKRVLQELPGCLLINGYGPTENTTFTCCYAMTQPDQVGSSVSIGRPIANTQVYVLDRYQQPVPIGIPGELYIGGEGLARGYLNRPELTTQRFVLNPFNQEENARLYKTGDLVRYKPNGTIEFLGRLDHQVKIRGFRIEPGEIEVVLREHPLVEDCLVTTHEDASGNKQLVAYVVSTFREGALKGVDLRGHLKKQLPDYMIPGAFVVLDAWPLDPNGKLDRRALPPLVWSVEDDGEQQDEPRSAVEQAIADIWQRVLGVPQIGIHANFFDIGGHSLLATRVIVQMREELQVDLPMRVLFEAPTIAELSAHVAPLLQNQPFSDLGAITAASDRQRKVESLLARLEELSDEEVETLLAELHTGKDAQK